MPFVIPSNRILLIAIASLLGLIACATLPHDSRRVNFSGPVNFRDLGGYATVDGRHVKQKMLYRSGDLNNMSRNDLGAFAELGIKQVYDLRTVDERAGRPNRFPVSKSLHVVEIPLPHIPEDEAAVRRQILSGNVSEGEFHRLRLSQYRDLALNFQREWSGLMRGLTEPGALPAMFHCREGKDRTGFGAAIVLRALGVPSEKVMEDYLLSNRFLQSRADRYSLMASVASFFRTPREEVRALLEVRPEYLEAAFAAIDERYGSFERYLHEGLDLDANSLERLRSTLLE